MDTVPTHHPAWCSPKRCTIDRPGLGVHRGRPHLIRTAGGAALAVSLWSSDRYPDGSPGPTYIELVCRHGAASHRAEDLTIGEARHLRHALTTLIDAAH